ncbi:MAG: hypothetical protein QM759_12945 [Terricaulis sp.]
MTSYRRRSGVVSRGEREWRVEDDALVSTAASGREQRFPWKDVIGVRLCSEPHRRKPWRYVFELQRKDGRKIEIDNAHFVRMGAFEERSGDYKNFVRAALARVAAANPKAKALIGETPRRYFFLILGGLLGLIAISYALIAVHTPLDQYQFAPLVKFAVIVLMLPVFWRWIFGAMPRGVALHDIPERALPPDATEISDRPELN